uniref:syntaphilin-like n=1 Tax=Myxine glutinosa TaxID=7769 RepID=UPI00358FE6AD
MWLSFIGIACVVSEKKANTDFGGQPPVDPQRVSEKKANIYFGGVKPGPSLTPRRPPKWQIFFNAVNKLWYITGDEGCVVSEKKFQVFTDGLTDGRTRRHRIRSPELRYSTAKRKGLKVAKGDLSSPMFNFFYTTLLTRYISFCRQSKNVISFRSVREQWYKFRAKVLLNCRFCFPIRVQNKHSIEIKLFLDHKLTFVDTWTERQTEVNKVLIKFLTPLFSLHAWGKHVSRCTGPSGGFGMIFPERTTMIVSPIFAYVINKCRFVRLRTCGRQGASGRAGFRRSVLIAPRTPRLVLRLLVLIGLTGRTSPRWISCRGGGRGADINPICAASFGDLLPWLGESVKHKALEMSSRKNSPCSSPRKSPISCPSDSPKRKATGSVPKRPSVPDVVARPQDAPSQCCSSCEDFETSPRLSRRWKYMSCNDNHGIKPPPPEQYLTPLQQKELSIRHLKCELKETRGQLQDRENEVEGLRMKVTQMRDDWVDGEYHRREAQHSLKDAKGEIRQLKTLVDLMKSSLVGKEKRMQKCFIDISIEPREQVDSLEQRNEAGPTITEQQEDRISDQATLRKTLPRRSTYTKLSENIHNEVFMLNTDPESFNEVVDRAIWTRGGGGAMVSSAVYIVPHGKRKPPHHINLPIISTEGSSQIECDLEYERRNSFDKIDACIQTDAIWDERWSGYQGISNGTILRSTVDFSSSPIGFTHPPEITVQGPHVDALPKGQTQSLPSRICSLEAVSRLQAILDKFDKVFSQDKKKSEPHSDTQQLIDEESDKVPLDKLANQNDPTFTLSGQRQQTTTGLTRSCSLEATALVTEPPLARPNYMSLDNESCHSTLPSDSPERGTADQDEGAAHNSTIEGRAFWSRHVLLDTIAVAGPFLPALAWFLGGRQGSGLPFNLPGLLRGCCLLALSSLRTVPQSLVSPLCRCTKPGNIGNPPSGK